MRPTQVFILLATSAACAGGAPPRDLSNAALPVTNANAIANTHAVREVEPMTRVRELLAAPDRAPEDRALDESRQAADLLTFLAVDRGMRVAELGCGRGYMTELLARAVGPGGGVVGQNAPAMLASPVETAWSARLSRPVDANVVRVDRPFADPFPPGTRGLDLVFLAIDYGQLVPFGVDRDAMNHAIHLALRRGGRYVTLDETPREGSITTDLRALHIDESRNARREIESAGFVFAAEGRFLRDGADPRDWDANPGVPAKGEKRDRFVLVFTKP